uniref:Uncharacterized protein n=1 Tax=Oryzias latipes TaxID=8090 RepID=A0A3P9JSR0_ORYLA
MTPYFLAVCSMILHRKLHKIKCLKTAIISLKNDINVLLVVSDETGNWIMLNLLNLFLRFPVCLFAAVKPELVDLKYVKFS